MCSCGSVVEHCVSSAKGCGFNSQGTHILKIKCIAWMHCKSLWIKASAKCINVNVTERDTQFERWMEDDRQPPRREQFTELDLNIHLYLTLNYVTASEHLKYSARKTLWCFLMCLWLLWGLTIVNTIVYAQYRIWIGLFWPIPRSGRKCQYRSDTVYRIGAPLLVSTTFALEQKSAFKLEIKKDLTFIVIIIDYDWY